MATPRPNIDRTATDTPVRRDPQLRWRSSNLNPNGDSSGELAAVVDDLLSQLNSKFSSISSELLAKSKILVGAAYGCD
jgi:heat shock factor-binding protein 1